MYILLEEALDYSDRVMGLGGDPVRRDLVEMVRAGVLFSSTGAIVPRGEFDALFFFRAFDFALEIFRSPVASTQGLEEPKWLMYRSEALSMLPTIKHEGAARIMRSYDAALLLSAEIPRCGFDMYFAFNVLRSGLDRQPALRIALEGKTAAVPWVDGFFRE